MFIVICENVEGEPTVFAPFESDEQAQEWISLLDPMDCPNEHYFLEAETPALVEV